MKPAKGRPPEAAADSEELVYWVDDRNHVIGANEAWYAFARVSGVQFPVFTEAAGMPLENFIHGRETRYLFTLVLDKVRQGRGPVILPLRCDAPDRRRFMEQTILLTKDRKVEVRCRLLKEELRPPVALLEREGMPFSSGEIVYCCAWCKKLEVAPGKWVEVEEFIRERARVSAAQFPRLSHGCCPDCTRHIAGLLT